MNNSLVGIFKKLGKLTELKTQNKESLVSSINEIADKTNGIDTVKNQVLNSVKSVEAGLNYNTIKITKNDGSTENVMIKVQGGASDSINVFKSSQKGGSFVATEVTSTFTIEDLDTTKDVDLIYNNLFLVKDVDYMVDKESKTVVLGFDLDINEIVYYILTNTSYDYNDLNNLPDLNLKVDKSQIKNILTETQVGNVLDATQGKVLNDKMGDTTQLLTVDKTSLVNAINELKRTGGGGGATLNVFKSTGGVWGEYVAESATNIFTIDGYNGTEKTVDLYYESVLLIPGKLFTISPIGEVTLSFQLDVGETIDYCISDVSFDYNELANKPDFDGLSSKVSVLNNDRGYLNSKLITSLSEITSNGKYNIYNSSEMPTQGRYVIDAICHASNYIHLEANGIYGNSLGLKYQRVISGSSDTGWQQIATTQMLNEKVDTKLYTSGTYTLSDFKTQGIYCFSPSATITDIPTGSNGWLIVLPSYGATTVKQIWLRLGTATSNSWQTYERLIAGSTVGEWTQYATTTKTAISLTPTTGYEFISQNNYEQNGKLFINLQVKKIDGTAFTTGTTTHFANLPYSKQRTALSAIGKIGGITKGTVNAFSTDVRVFISVVDESVIEAVVTGVIEI